MIWKKQPVGSKLEALNSKMALEIGSSTSTIAQSITSGLSSIPNDGHPTLIQVKAMYGAVMGFITKYSNNYGSGVLSRYDGKYYGVSINNGTVTVEELALSSKMGDYHTNSSTSTYASWDVKYSIVGRVCTFIFGFTPSTNISSSIGSIGDTGLPNPASTDYVCIYPVTKVQQSYTVADIQNRFGGVKNIGSSNPEVKAVGAYESGVKYSFCGSYVIA